MTPAQSEQERHRQAFEVYRSLGSRRSYRRVAEQFGVSTSAVKLWATKYNWQERIRGYNAQTARQTADKVIGSAVESASRKRKMVELALMKVIKAINADQVKVQVGDLDRLLRLQAFLDGDRVPLTVEALKGHSIEEAADLIYEWFFSLNEEEQARALKALRKTESVEKPPIRPRAAIPQSTPAEGQFSGSEGSERDSPQNGPTGGP